MFIIMIFERKKSLLGESFFTLLHLIKYCETLNIFADFMTISVSLFSLPIIFYVEVPGAQRVKHLPAMREIWV